MLLFRGIRFLARNKKDIQNEILMILNIGNSSFSNLSRSVKEPSGNPSHCWLIWKKKRGSRIVIDPQMYLPCLLLMWPIFKIASTIFYDWVWFRTMSRRLIRRIMVVDWFVTTVICRIACCCPLSLFGNRVCVVKMARISWIVWVC